MTIDQAFNQTADYYDSWMKKALPSYRDLFGIPLELVPFKPDAVIDVLDLGAGTGLFSKHVLEKYPRARFVLYDLATTMLDVAKERFHDHAAQFRYIIGDYRNIQNVGAFDLVISSLSIHHLEDTEKKELFRRIYDLLGPAGLFINIDQIKGPTPALKKLYWDTWLEKVRRSGEPEERIQASIQRRTTFDKDALLTDQLEWLREAGFTDVDCIYKNYFIGVFYAKK